MSIFRLVYFEDKKAFNQQLPEKAFEKLGNYSHKIIVSQIPVHMDPLVRMHKTPTEFICTVWWVERVIDEFQSTTFLHMNHNSGFLNLTCDKSPIWNFEVEPTKHRDSTKPYLISTTLALVKSKHIKCVLPKKNIYLEWDYPASRISPWAYFDHKDCI